MTLRGLTRRIEPLARKLAGRLPLCPWRCILAAYDPRTIGAHPPAMKIELIAEVDGLKRLRFDGRHEAWFPAATAVNLELWNEYLSVFWAHPANAHRYLSHGTPIAPGDVVIDGGCCEGFFVFQALAAGAAKVIGIEPNPHMVRCLEKTFAAEIQAGRVVIISAALGAFHGRASFAFDAAYPAFGQLQDQTGEQSVVVETITRICERLALPRLDYVKMDIEGAELQAVEGALPALRKFHPKLAITTYHREFDYACLRALLTGAGYGVLRPVGLTQFGQPGHYRPTLLHGSR